MINLDSKFSNLPIVLSEIYPGNHFDNNSGDCDCSGGDCACGTPSLFLLPSTNEKNLVYTVSPEMQSIKIDKDFSVYFGPFQIPTVLNVSGEQLLSNFKQPSSIDIIYIDYKEIWARAVFDMAIKGFKDSGNIIQANVIPKLIENKNSLTAWVHVTDRCNLRCDYCYLPHLREDMTMKVGRASVDSLLRSAKINNFSYIKIKYAGGESLIRFDFIEELHSYAIKAAEQFGIQLSGVILSNGTLLNSSIAQRIKQLKLSLMISLDGLGAVHDTQRKFASGQGSFESVQTGIQTALREGLSPHISITVSGKNAHGLPELIQWILENDLTFSINFYRENELAISKEELNLDEGKIISGILAAYKMIEKNLPRRSLLSGLVDRANLSSAHSHTCGVGRNYMVFDWKGMVSKCQMQMKRPVATVHDTDPLKLIQLDQTGIQNLPVDQKNECDKCEWKHWCTGGCSLLTHSVTGRYDLKSPNCKIYKAIYPEAMRLEGLRLIKYAEVLND